MSDEDSKGFWPFYSLPVLHFTLLMHLLIEFVFCSRFRSADPKKKSFFSSLKRNKKAGARGRKHGGKFSRSMPHLSPTADVKTPQEMNGSVCSRTDRMNLSQAAKPGEENGASGGLLSPDGQQLTECSATDINPGSTVSKHFRLWL